MALQTTGAISIGDIATEFGDSAPNSMSEFYGAGGAPASGEITIGDFYGLASFTMPSGIIIPFTGASTPSGWAAFSSADNKALVGAGSTYSNGSTGGSDSFSIATSTSSTGSHTYPNNNLATGSGSYGFHASTTSRGDHSHTVTLAASSVPPQYRQYKFIKASSDQSAVPAGGIILGRSTITGDGVANYDSGNNGIMRAGSSVASGGNNSVSLSGTTSSAGSHNHNNSNGYGKDSEGGSTRYFAMNSAGAHTHSASSTLTWNVKRYILTAWQNASADFSFEGSGICMWESATPPDGWYICNGANGTPDLRDYFIQIGSTGTHGTSAGNNSNSYTAGTAAGDASHAHNSGGSDSGSTSGGGSHYGFTWNHSHSIGSGSVSQLPPYYGIYFIQKAA